VREAKLFEAKLGPIDGVGNVGRFLMQLAEGKPVAQPAPAPAPAAEPQPEKSGEKFEANGEKVGEQA
jgi:vacuolar protein sorting-associated protein 54